MKPSSTCAIGRREFIAAGTAIALSAAGGAAAASARPPALIDTNVSLGRWPFRRLPLDETPALVAKLRDNGVTQAWAGTFDALLHKDVAAANSRLADDCAARGGGILLPVGSVNPMLPDWEEDLRRCSEVHKMRGIRLHPNYHGYPLIGPVFERVLELAIQRRLLVQIAVIMEEERTIHPLVNVPPTDTAPLPGLMRRFPRARVQLLNAFRTLRGKPLSELAAAGVHFEIATLEGVAGISNLLTQISSERILFGSHAPFFYFESAALKLKESILTDGQLQSLRADNARLLLA